MKSMNKVKQILEIIRIKTIIIITMKIKIIKMVNRLMNKDNNSKVKLNPEKLADPEDLKVLEVPEDLQDQDKKD